MLPRLHVRDRDSDDYPTFWAIVEKDGRLLCGPLDAEDFGDAEEELWNDLPADGTVTAKAICRFTHPAYAYPERARDHAVDLMLEEASRVFGVPFGTEVK